MNKNMAALAKGAVTVATVFGVLVAGTASLFRMPAHRGTPAPPPTGESAPAPATPPQAATGVSGNLGSGTTGSSGTAGPVGTATSGGAPANPAAAAAPPAPSRKATDFSFPQARWDQLLAQNADAASSAALANSGKPSAGVAACASCHGAQGVPPPGTVFPVLAGAPAAYIAKQLLDYRDGTRQHPIMTGIAKGLNDQDIAAVARYYSGLPAPALKPPAANPQDRAQRLHGFGDNGLALAACANCHGANGEGESPMLPRLAGQPEAYVSGQLEAFRNGQRVNDDLGTMRDIAKRLTAQDTAALAKYYAGMRPQETTAADSMPRLGIRAAMARPFVAIGRASLGAIAFAHSSLGRWSLRIVAAAFARCGA
jgi:cytochrome c553